MDKKSSFPSRGKHCVREYQTSKNRIVTHIKIINAIIYYTHSLEKKI